MHLFPRILVLVPLVTARGGYAPYFSIRLAYTQGQLRLRKPGRPQLPQSSEPRGFASAFQDLSQYTVEA